MKILMFGRGVIATQYAWAFEKAGHDVEFYVRPGRIALYGTTVDLDILDGRKNPKGDRIVEKWPAVLREEFSPEDNYDLIIISVNHNQLTEAAKFTGSRAGNATILIFNNIWADPQTIAAYLPKGQVLWGFPGGGGGYQDTKTLKAGFFKKIFFESASTAASKPRYHETVKLFENAGFSVSRQKDMRVWLWEHFIMNAAMAAQALKAGGYMKLFESKAGLKQMVLLMREMLPMIRAKGGKPGFGTALMVRLPAGLMVHIFQKISSQGSLTGELLRRLEDSGHTTQELTGLYPRDVMAEADEMGIKLPMLAALKQYYS